MEEFRPSQLQTICRSCGSRLGFLNHEVFDRCELCDEGGAPCMACGKADETVMRGTLRLCRVCDAELSQQIDRQRLAAARRREAVLAAAERDGRMAAARRAMRQVTEARERRENREGA